jgi:hypothetical protein
MGLLPIPAPKLTQANAQTSGIYENTRLHMSSVALDAL